MATNKSFSACLLLVLCGLCAACAGDVSNQDPHTQDTLQEAVVVRDTIIVYDTIRREVPAQEDPGGCLVASYLGEIGIREEGGNNRGERIQEYLQAVNLGPGFAWCAAFICWNLDQCDITNPSSAWSPAVGLYNVIYSRGDEVFPSARPGLVFALYYKNLGRIGHVGFIHQVKDEQVITVEGNTNGDGSRDGDGVHKKIRPTWAIYRVSSYL